MFQFVPFFLVFGADLFCDFFLQLMFRELIPPILNVSRLCLANGDEDVAILAFEIFDELVESPAPLLGPTIPVIVQFALEVCSNKHLEDNTRHQVKL
jgi:hypothetical protein